MGPRTARGRRDASGHPQKLSRPNINTCKHGAYFSPAQPAIISVLALGHRGAQINRCFLCFRKTVLFYSFYAVIYLRHVQIPHCLGVKLHGKNSSGL
jgi:hypothetical protein